MDTLIIIKEHLIKYKKEYLKILCAIFTLLIFFIILINYLYNSALKESKEKNWIKAKYQMSIVYFLYPKYKQTMDKYDKICFNYYQNEGLKYLEQNKYEKMRKCFIKARKTKVVKNSNNKELLNNLDTFINVGYYICKGSDCLKRNEFEKAINYYTMAVNYNLSPVNEDFKKIALKALSDTQNLYAKHKIYSMSCSDIDKEIINNWANKNNFDRNEYLIDIAFDKGCNIGAPDHDKYSYLATNAMGYNAYCEENGNYSNAIICAQKVIDYANKSEKSFIKSSTPLFIFNIAKNYYRLGQYKNSKQYCLKVLPLTTSPTNTTAILEDFPVIELLADNECKLGEKQNALIHYEKALHSFDIFINNAYKYSITGDISQEIKDKYYRLKQKYEDLYSELYSTGY